MKILNLLAFIFIALVALWVTGFGQLFSVVR